MQLVLKDKQGNGGKTIAVGPTERLKYVKKGSGDVLSYYRYGGDNEVPEIIERLVSTKLVLENLTK
jgi:hypothetical protein